MRIAVLFLSLIFSHFPLFADDTTQNLVQKLSQLQAETKALQNEVHQLQNQLKHPSKISAKKTPLRKKNSPIRKSPVYIHTRKGHPESIEFYPTALLTEGKVVTFIGGTPVVTAPYLGSRPAFDGSDYIVNISSINRDIRLMQQRRQLYRAFKAMDYPEPNVPIVALSGRIEPIGNIGNSYNQDVSVDWNLGSAELDAAAALNSAVEGYITLAYDPTLSAFSNQRIGNSAFGLGMGFINIGDLDRSPFYFTAGQIFVPFGRYSTNLVSAPLTMMLSRTKSRPFIFGYKSQEQSGPFAAIYGFEGDTTLGNSGVGGVNLGYDFLNAYTAGDVGISFISSINSAGGMQANGATLSNFAGFASLTHGSEYIKNIPAVDVHGTLRFSSYNLTAEWSGTTQRFREQDLSFNGEGASPQALQLEIGKTFVSFARPSSFAIGYQWSRQALALRLPEYRATAVYNISIWKDTVESLEYRHDIDYRSNQFANGAAPSGVINTNTIGTGTAADMVLVQIGVYF